VKTSFYDENELSQIGFKYIGKNVLISRYSRFYSIGTICVGSNVRIDDFCIISGNVSIGDYVHISSSSTLTGGKAGIVIEDFANISQRVNIFANSDDFSGETMSNPMIPEKYKNLVQKKVVIKRHAIIACGSVILPGVTVGEGGVCGALSLVKDDIPEWQIFGGLPAKFLKERSRNLLELEIQFLSEASKE
jgi:acetyltransferase-like isoleucine patch superfamily enzyme